MTRLDRRALFTSGAAASLLAAAGVTLEAAPRSGGRLRIAVPRPDGPLPPAARAAVFDTLTEVGPDRMLRGELLTGWHGSADARVWHLELRRNVQFHSGQPFSSLDVSASLAYHGDRQRLGIATMDLLAEDRMRLELTAGNPDLPYLLADPDLVICPADRVETALTECIGTGLYRARYVQPGRHFLGERVVRHYKDGRAGWFDSLEIVVIPDPIVRAQALGEGFVDVADRPAPDALLGRDDFILLPSPDRAEFAARRGVGLPSMIGRRAPLDDGRISERWWMG